MPRVLGFVESREAVFHCQPIGVGGSITEEADFYYGVYLNGEPGEEQYAKERREAVIRYANEIGFDLRVSWDDVFGKSHETSLSLWAYIDATPNSPNRKRATSGKLNFRVDGIRHEIEAQAEQAD